MTTDYTNSTLNSDGVGFSYDASRDSTLSAAYINNVTVIIETYYIANRFAITSGQDVYIEVDFENFYYSESGGSVALNKGLIAILFLGGGFLCILCTCCTIAFVMCCVYYGKISYFEKDLNWGALFPKDELEDLEDVMVEGRG
ncbi:Aats-ala [Acrasis kona]|uniref:Aats-ala n=1 Tax=Acrasis kona TaxID=1008807 RepID=A0AAW2Z592_9EUKA